MIPSSFEEYLERYPKHAIQQANICLRKFGKDTAYYAEDLSQYILMMLFRKKAVESFDLSKRNPDGKPLDEKSQRHLFFHYLNLCCWRYATSWVYQACNGYIKNKAGNGITQHQDAMGFIDPKPEESYKHNGVERNHLEAMPRRAIETYQRAEHDHDTHVLMQELLAYMRSVGTKKKNLLADVLELHLQGCTDREIGTKLGMTDGMVGYRVRQAKALAKRRLLGS